MTTSRIWLAVMGLVLAVAPLRAAQQQEREPRRTLYVVATAHLDTQWRWTVRDTIEKFIPATLRDNFALFEKYPDYTFSFEGAFRYMLAKEYYPAEYEKLKRYVRQGRWRVAGSWVDAVDTNIPSPESLFRQALYGNGFFRRELGVESRDVYLPDCFGFGFALPSIAAHSGLVGFSTQKLTWGSSVGVPFDVGTWEGVDGSRLVSALNPGDYAASIYGDLSGDPKVIEAIDRVGKASGAFVDLRYFGTGDVGGSPDETSVEWLEKSLAGGGPVTVRSVGSDQLARDLAGTAEGRRLPRYRGELLMTSHGAGCYTSQAAMKRFNRRNERLADAAERAAVAADWLGGSPYPRQTLRDAWVRFLWHQFHDDLTGTSIPEAYEISWNDEAIAQNQLAGVLSDSVGAVVRALDTRMKGVPLVVFNPLSIAREDVVEADVVFPGSAPHAVRVMDRDGKEIPAQVSRTDNATAHVVFVARVPSVGFAVFEVRPITTPAAVGSELSIHGRVLENARYRVTLDQAGDIVSVHDKQNDRELLAGPIRLQLLRDEPAKWPAWEVDLADLSDSPRAVVSGPARLRIAESGPARVALEVARDTEGSSFVQTIRLAAGGAGDVVEVTNEIDWRTTGTLLKAAFPLAAGNQTATYDLGLGTIERGVSTPKLYEVPGQEWADVTAPDGRYGVAVLNDSKYGWDHPEEGTLRLTLLHTPGIREKRWAWVGDQASMDLGHHRVVIGLVGHAGDWRQGGVTWLADRLNQPLLAWQAPRHAGALGRTFSLASVRGAGPNSAAAPVAVRAVKLAEESGEVVVRMEELLGRPDEVVRLSMARPITGFREIDAAEEPLGPADPRLLALPAIVDGALFVRFAPYQPRTFALRLAAPPVRLAPPTGAPVSLPYNLEAITLAGAAGGDFDGAGHTLAGELVPETIVTGGIPFRTGPVRAGVPNLVACRGQHIRLPGGEGNRLYLLAAAVGGDRKAELTVGGRSVALWMQDWAEPIGQWDDRLDGGVRHDDPAEIVPGFVKPARLGWLGTHRHDTRGNDEPYTFTSFFLYRIDLPPGADSVTLPVDPAVRVLAATVAHDANDDAVPAQPFHDVAKRAVVRIRAPRRIFIESLDVAVTSPTPHAVVRYTTDGSPPAASSPVADGPVTLTDSATIRARAFAPGLDTSFVAQASFARVKPRAAAPPPSTSPGLRCRYVEGSWRVLPDLDALPPAREGIVPAVAPPPFARPEYFAVELSGYLRVPADGVYVLSLRSDDTAALDLDGGRLIDPADTNGGGDDRREVALAAGLHPMTVRYLHRKLAPWVELWIEGPGFAMRPVGPEELLHD
jgi:alpha-mannosidase